MTVKLNAAQKIRSAFGSSRVDRSNVVGIAYRVHAESNAPRQEEIHE